MIGIIGGVLGGMGMGGGTLFIPLITIFMGVDQIVAQAVNLVAFIPMALVTLIIHFKNKLIKFQSVIYLLFPAIITATLTAFFAFDIGSEILRKCFGVFLIIVSLAMTVCESVKFFKKKNN